MKKQLSKGNILWAWLIDEIEAYSRPQYGDK